MTRNVDPKRLGLHAGTLSPVDRFEEKAGGLLLDTFYFHRGGSTLEMLDEIPVHLADVPPGRREQAQDDGRLPPGEGAGPLGEIVARVLNKGHAGYFVVEVLSQSLWREDALEVARRCHAGAVKVLGSV